MTCITGFQARAVRIDMEAGDGSDAVHTDPQYGYAVTLLQTDSDLVGTGLTFTLGPGAALVCEAIKLLAEPVVGRDIEELMAEFGKVQKAIAEHQALRWLGPHKGVVHLALASISIACFDLWAKSRGVPRWMEFDAEQLQAKITSLPTREDVSLPVQEKLIVELYSK